MTTIDLGAPVTAVWSGAPAGGTYAITITRPDGTSFTPPTIMQTQPVQAAFVPDMAGRWLIRWTSTGKAGSYSDVADVWPNDPRFIISLDDAKTALGMLYTNATSQDPVNLDDLRLYIAAATPVIEDIVGTVVTKTVTQTMDGNVWAIPLWEKPVSIVSITEIGNPLTEYVVDYEAGLVYAGKTFALRRFQPGFQTVVITYTTGSNTVPQNVRLATRELVRHWWQLGRQAQRPAVNAMPDAWTPSGFAVPKRVIELCSANERSSGFA